MAGKLATTEFSGTTRFQVLRRLGAGGMGVVYEALDRERNARVALKTLRTWSADAFIRFKNEFRALQDIQHPNLVSLGELVEDRGQWFFTMELVEGTQFLRWVRAGGAATEPPSSQPSSSDDKAAAVGSSQRSTDERSTVDERAPVAGAGRSDEDTDEADTVDVPQTPSTSPRGAASAGGAKASRAVPPVADERRLRAALGQLALGLHALHTAKRIHRDIKPSNILVAGDGRVKILDFGLVTDLHNPREAGGEDHLIGTASYMAPEQAVSQDVGPEADWYSVGVVLYQALTGRLPFAGAPERVILLKQAIAAVPPHALVQGLPVDLDRLCVDLLHIEPKLRPTGREVLRRLRVDQEGSLDPYSSSFSSSPVGTSFVGRRDELTTLRRAFEDARQGRTIAMLVHGESGVGKSALTRRFTDALTADAEAVVLAGRCYERESVPFKAVDGVVDALGRYLGLIGPDVADGLLPDDAYLLGQVFPVMRRLTRLPPMQLPSDDERASGAAQPDAQDLRARTFAALREVLRRLALRRPLVLVIDDLQWADADSLALLGEVLRPPSAPSLLLVATVRAALEGEGATRSAAQMERQLLCEVRQLHVASLPPDDAQALVGLLVRSSREGGERGDAGAPMPDMDAEAIAREAGGHPLFIDELIRGRLVLGEERPVRLEEALWARIQRLAPSLRRLLELVAVAGAPIAQETAAHAAERELGPLSEEVSQLRAAHLVRTTGARVADAIEPYHDRVRNAVLGRLGPEARQGWHRRLALAFEAGGSSSGRVDAEALATHWRGAGELDRAAGHALRAANEASAALAFDRAARLYRLALSLRTVAGDEARQLETLLGDALGNAGRGPEAAAAYLAAAGAVAEATDEGNVNVTLDLQRRAADQLLRSGHIDEGLDVIRAVLGAAGMKLPGSARGALVSLLGRRAQIRLRLGGLGFRERAEKQIDPATLTRIDVCWSVAAGLGLVDNVRGSYFQTRGLLLSLQAGEPFRIARALAAEAAFSSAGGGPSRARTAKLLGAAEALAARVGHPYGIAWVTGVGGITAALEGRWPTGLARCEESEALLRDRCVGVAWELAIMRWFSLWSLAYLGRLDELARRVPLRLRDAEGRGDLHAEIGHSTGLAGLTWLAADDPDEARRRGVEAMARWSHKTFHVEHWWNMLGQVQVDLYRGDGAAAYQGVLEQWPGLKSSLLLMVQLTRLEATHLRARAALQAASAAPASEARALLASCARDARKIAGEQMPWSTPLAVLLEAGVAAARGDQERSLRLLPDAAAGLDDAGMALYAAAARHRRGTLLGGDEGRDLVQRAEAWMTAQGIRRVDRMLALLAPGFPD